MRVFIVDDSELLRRRVREAVTSVPAAIVVGEAADAASALAGIRESRPDLVVLDIVFPGGGGRAVLRGLTTFVARPDVIVLTNHPEPEYRRHFMRRGVLDVFDKSLEFDRFSSLLATLARTAVEA